MAFFSEWLDTLEGSYTDEQVAEILDRIRTSPFDELDGNVFAYEFPLFVIYTHYVANNLESQRDLNVLLEITRAFVERGINITVCGFEDTTLLHYAIDFGEHNIELIRYLCENGINVSRENTAFKLAQDLGRQDIIDCLSSLSPSDVKEPGFE